MRAKALGIGADPADGERDVCIALVRGINVGGKRIVPMAELVKIFEAVGATEVETHIQSGNVVFRLAAGDGGIGERAAALVSERFGFAPQVLTLSVQELAHALNCVPFDVEPSEAGRVLLYFLAAAPARLDRDALDAVKANSETWHVEGRVFYLHAPEGTGRSKLAQRAEKILSVDATARNLQTCRQLLERASRLLERPGGSKK